MSCSGSDPPSRENRPWRSRRRSSLLAATSAASPSPPSAAAITAAAAGGRYATSTLCTTWFLGVITEDVVELRKSIGAPGMTVLQFVVYTGTYDNDTVSSNYFKVLGWWQNLPEGEKQTVLRCLSAVIETDISWALITAVLSSVVRTSIVIMQDILGLDSSARMNTPATQKGNWRWRMPSSVGFDSLSPEAAKLKELLALYNQL